LASDDDSGTVIAISRLSSFHIEGSSNRDESLVTVEHNHFRVIVNQDGAAILDTKAGRISTLNASGAYIWQALERGEDIESIAQGLARETGEPIDAVKTDMADFIEALKRQDLLPG
jgi:hypothetical protein